MEETAKASDSSSGLSDGTILEELFDRWMNLLGATTGYGAYEDSIYDSDCVGFDGGSLVLTPSRTPSRKTIMRAKGGSRHIRWPQLRASNWHET